MSTAKILTANRLTDGEAVWLADGFAWSVSIADAILSQNTETTERFELEGRAASARNEVVDVALVDVKIAENGEIIPIRLRERIRAAGPTNRPDLGKQATQQQSARESAAA